MWYVMTKNIKHNVKVDAKMAFLVRNVLIACVMVKYFPYLVYNEINIKWSKFWPLEYLYEAQSTQTEQLFQLKE